MVVMAEILRYVLHLGYPTSHDNIAADDPECNAVAR
jgi:hypothetical protein